MTIFWWTVTAVLIGLLAMFSVFAEFVGLIGLMTGRGYERCPRCHHHYFASDGKASGHDCPDGREERLYQWTRRHLHHAT